MESTGQSGLKQARPCLAIHTNFQECSFVQAKNGMPCPTINLGPYWQAILFMD